MNSQKAENPSSWPETREGRKEKLYKQIKGEGKKSFISLVIFYLNSETYSMSVSL